MEFAQRLSLLLEERGVSRGKLARFVGVHTSTVTNWVNGKKPSVDNLASVADFFGVSVSYLVGWDEAVSDLNMIGMSELDVAKEMGIDPAVLNNILSGNDASSAEAVSKFITVASLLAQKEKPIPQTEDEPFEGYSDLTEEEKKQVRDYAAFLLASRHKQ